MPGPGARVLPAQRMGVTALAGTPTSSEPECQGPCTSDFECEGWPCLFLCPSPCVINQLEVYANVSPSFPGHMCEMIGRCFRNKDGLF